MVLVVLPPAVCEADGIDYGVFFVLFASDEIYITSLYLHSAAVANTKAHTVSARVLC